jgi:aldehyde dehydrogenase (NAD+)
VGRPPWIAFEIDGLELVLDELDLTGELPGVFDGYNWFSLGPVLESRSPINGQLVGRIRQSSKEDYEQTIRASREAFKDWRNWPAPKRGEVVRRFGEKLREKKQALGQLITIEMGKSLQEGLGEVQEMIDICDMAVGQSRMLYGVQMHSERRQHQMYEQWHPLGVVAVITAFNFPTAVWAWNLAIALVAGNSVVWKPSSATPLTAIACQKLLIEVLEECGAPRAISTLVIGSGSEVGEWLIKDRRVDLVSFTGSVTTGRHVSTIVASRFGKTILELGGNNAIIVTQHADLDLAVKAIMFGAIGTSGQRCTTTRRVIVARSIYPDFISLLKTHYNRIDIGNPLKEQNLMGPLVIFPTREVVTSDPRWS